MKQAYGKINGHNLDEWNLDLDPFDENNRKTTMFIKGFVNGMHPDLKNRDAVVNSKCA